MSRKKPEGVYTPPKWLFPTVVGVALAGFTVWAWHPRDALEAHVREGNSAYGQRDFPHALERYEAAPGDGARNAGVHMNRGLARYRIALAPGDGGVLPEFMDASAPEGYDRAQDEIRNASRGMPGAPMEDIDTTLRARAAYNLGNTYFSEHSWQNAIDSYKESLRLKPGWIDAAWNLELARLRKEEEDRPDAAPDAAPDAPQDAPQDAQDAASDAPQDAPQDSGGDSGQGDSGQQGDSGEQGDSGQQGDGGQPGDSGGGDNDASTPPPQGDGGAQPPPPVTTGPLDELERTGQDLQQMLLRRRAAQMPRNPDDER